MHHSYGYLLRLLLGAGLPFAEADKIAREIGWYQIADEVLDKAERELAR